MAKLCPFKQCTQVCSSECALRIDEECAITNIAKSFRRQEIQKEVWSKVMNMQYGTTQQKFNDDIIKEVSKHE